ncbi:MAG: LysR substrate-binding domain-containing protein [Paracoccaceae bacterium]
MQADLTLDDSYINLVAHRVDLAVRIGTLTDSSDIVRRVGATRRLAVASPSYLETTGIPQRPDDLISKRLISFTSLTPARSWRFFGDGPEQEVPVNPTYTTNSADAAIWHACNGGGVTMVLSYQVEHLVRDGLLQIVLENFEPRPYPIQLVYPSARHLSPKVRAFVDLVAETQQWSFLDL